MSSMRERAELAGLVEVDVDTDAVALGDGEDDVEVGHRVAVVAARIEAADEVGAGPHRGVQQVGGAGVAEDAGLREGDHLDGGTRRVGLTCRQHALQPLQPGVGIDLDVTADHRGAGGDRRAERRGRPLADRGAGGPPVRPVVADQAGQPGFGGVRPEREPEARRVEMGVGIGERRQQHATPTVRRRHARGYLAGGDPAVPDEHVDRRAARLARPQPHVPEQQISHRPIVPDRHTESRLAAMPTGSTAAAMTSW